MQKHIARTGILLIVGLFSLLACARRGALGDQDKPAELEQDIEPTVTSMTVPPTPLPQSLLPDLGLAPEINNEIWLNSDTPLSLETLAGKVVLLEFWTFG